MLSIVPSKSLASRKASAVGALLGKRRTIKGPAVPVVIGGDGMWTWFNDRRAIYRNGCTYVGVVTLNGSIGVYRYQHGNRGSTFFNLNAALQEDDHDNPSLIFTPDGKLGTVYAQHGADALVRYRLASGAESIEAFATEGTFSAVGLVSYSNIHYLSANSTYYNHYRANSGPRYAIKSADFAAWGSETQWLVNLSLNMYVKAIDNGVDRIDLFFTNAHPDNAGTLCSVYHCYMQLDEGTEKFYETDGTYISTGSVTPAQASLVWSGATADGEAWTWDIGMGSDGHPRVVFARFPTLDDHRYMHGRWSGSAWVVSDITEAGGYLYVGQEHYSGGICLDAVNPDRVYLSKYVTNTWELQEWRTADNGATWAKYRDISTASGSGVVNARPYSPRNHDGSICVVWWKGRYTDFTDYDCDIMGIGSA